ncbi:MAG: hypothetical protein ABW185_11650 [Sedimenticola sp.]
MTRIEDRMDRMEINNREHITHEIGRTKENMLQDMRKDINKMVDERSNELNDRRNREMNIVVFNLEEGRNASGEENKEYDKQAMKEITESLGVTDLEILTLYRLGKKNAGVNRVLIVVISNKQQRKCILENARHIQKKVVDKYKKVVIGKDRTPQQREEWKEARKKRPTPRSDTERRDSEDRRHESEMDTNVQQLDLSPILMTRTNIYHRGPDSPILEIPNSQHENEENTPIHITDETVVGGIDMSQKENAASKIQEDKAVKPQRGNASKSKKVNASIFPVETRRVTNKTTNKYGYRPPPTSPDVERE